MDNVQRFHIKLNNDRIRCIINELERTEENSEVKLIFEQNAKGEAFLTIEEMKSTEIVLT
tara:strand:+ start:8201 stop:8380 length:180 start_codon:yes stop_codon:yes gene_type:complete